MELSRRGFVAQGAAIVSGAICNKPEAFSKPNIRQTVSRPLIISTWPFGEVANKKAMEVINSGGSSLDAVEKGINVTENDKENTSVGIGGLPNSEGVVQLDACIMHGPGHKAGSVMGIERIRNPISVARKIMEHTRHVQLVGKGAQEFALSQGFTKENLLTEKSKGKWLEWKKNNQKKRPEGSIDNHDTITLLMLDEGGNLTGGCSTSGLAFKLPGRVGDSPIIGSGLYVDNEVGAAGATGVGENVLRHCCSFMIVEFMRQGLSPQDACIKTIKRAAKIDPLGMDLNIFFIAVDKKGRYGAAGTGKGFQYSVTTPKQSEILDSAGPVGGNEFHN
jgi:isoaspartyl peptidase/L-asparaginase-like protein (Ntn-hydrolase superfamily)|tara:strand:- start:3103 stop:4104 length:1002 start_codon:yes stop_codon:yes gene_type:complete